MCSEIDARTRDNPEAALGHTRMPGWTDELVARAIENLGARPMVTSNADPVLKAEREARVSGGQLPAPHAEAIDRAAYDRFMRSLG
jgi:hypothetical protein